MNAKPEIVTEDGEIIESGALVALDSKLAVDIARAEIDQQITTAKQYPRSVTRVANNILSLATLDDQCAEECMYALPRGGKPITGPSVRLAEIVAGQWGNNRVAARMVDVNRAEKYVEAEGVFHDLETNAATKATVRRRIVDSRGRIYSDDMIIVTGNAACSIARRNAILAGVPKAVWRHAYERAEAVVKGDIKTLVETRDKATKAFAIYGVKPEQVYAALGVAGDEEVTLEHIPVLRGMFAAIKNGEATVEEMFTPTARNGSSHEKVENALSDKPGATAKPQGAPQSADAPSAADGPGETADAPAAAAAGQEGASETLSQQAHRLGRMAAFAGQARKALPGELRGTEEGLSWQDGWDEAKAEADGA